MYIIEQMLKKIILVLWIASSVSLSADVIRLKAFDFDDGHHQFYFNLLETALSDMGHELELELYSNVPQKRIEFILDNDEESYIHFFIQTEERDERWNTINLGLTNSLIAHRVLFIPRGKQSVYNDIGNLDDFRSKGLIGAFGANWYDIDVWKFNDLNFYAKDGDWRTIYRMLSMGNRNIDYFSRGVTEILGEATLYPQLDIEEKLLFIYSRDFHLYFTESVELKYRSIIEEALLNGKKRGLIDKLIRKYYSEDFDRLNFDNRIRIYLDTP